MEFLTDHFLDLQLTGPGPMNTTSEVQHDNFARQLSALEKLLVISHSRLSLEELHKNLKLVLKAGNKGMLKITSIDSLIECVELYKTTSTSSEESEKISLYFEKYLKEVAHLAQVKKFFHNTIYHSLYEFFYDPVHDDSEDDAEQEEERAHSQQLYLLDEISDDDDDEDAKSDPDNHLTPSPNPQDYPAPFQIQAPKPKKKKKPKGNTTSKHNTAGLGNVKKKKRKDNRMKVLERIQKEKAEREAQLAKQRLEEPQSGKQFEKLKNKTDKQRLAFAVRNIFEIQSRWNNLITQGPISSKDFEDDSLRQIRDYKGYLPVEAVFRLIPDILVKGFKLIELSKIWYNCSRRITGPGTVTFRTMPEFLEKIKVLEHSVVSIENDIKYKKDLKLTKQSERKLLMNQVHRFEEVKEKYDNCVEKERELKDYYKQLKQERNAEYPKLEQMSREDPKYREGYDQIQYLADSMRSVYRELQTASYELALIKQDYTVEMGARANLIRQQDDIKFTIQDIDISLPLNEQQRQQSIRTYEMVGANCSRMWIALYQKRADEKLTKQADNILKNKHPQEWINKPSNELAKNASSPTQDKDSDGEGFDDELERTLTDEQKFSEDFDRETSSNRSESLASPATLPHPLTPQREKSIPEKRIHSRDFNPSTAGILDEHEAKEYRERVDRLKKKFELDLSGLKTDVDCKVEFTPRAPQVASASGDEADMDSEQEDIIAAVQSKKVNKHRPSVDRYSPLSDASDEYIFQQQKVFSSPRTSVPKTVYILTKSEPRGPPANRYILKTVPGAKPLPPALGRQPPVIHTSPDQHRVKARKPQAGNDYQTLAALDSNFVNTLSVYKRSPLHFGNSLTPILPLEHQEGVFTPYRELSDGDISIDSGTGNSLDSGDDTDRRTKKAKGSGYKHKSRLTVREQLAIPKQDGGREKKSLPAKEKSKLPTLQKKKPAAYSKKPLAPRPHIQPALSPAYKSSPESLVSHPVKPPQNRSTDRSTLFTRKPNHPLPPAKPKPSRGDLNESHPFAAAAAVPIANKGVQRKLPLGKAPRFKPVTVPKQRGGGQHVRIIESQSDDDELDEIFKQTSVRSKLPPKPSVRQALVPPKNKRRTGLRSLGRAY